MKKVTTKVTSAKTNNGLHSVRHFRSAKKMLETHDYQDARLYHLCLIGSTQVKPYLKAIKQLVEHLRDHNCRCQYKAALEQDDSKELHMHIFLLVEAKHYRVDGIINRKDGWLKTMILKNDIDFYINHPRDPLHYRKDGSQKLYATLPVSKPEKLADCIEWISYLYKNRSKPNVKTIYFSSRPTKEAKRIATA